MVRCLALAACLNLVSFLQAHGGEGDWSRFRGPNGSGVSDATTVPAHWSDKDYNWKIELPGVGHSSPVVWGRRVFVTCGDPKSALRILLCIDAASGRTLWRRDYPSKTYPQHPENNYASATPAADARGVVLTWTTPEQVLVVALDLNGRELWRRDMGPFISLQGSGNSPILFEDLVVLANEQEDMNLTPGQHAKPAPVGTSSLMALDRKSGQTRWLTQRRTSFAAYSTPCVWRAGSRAELIFTSTEHGITAVDPANGNVLWEFGRPFRDRTISSPIVDDGLVIAGHGAGLTATRYVAVRPDPSQLDKQPTLVHEFTRSIPLVPTPIVKNGRLFFWTDDGVVSCVRCDNGSVVWRGRVGGGYYASPVWVAGRLYCVSRSGEVVVVSASDKFEILARVPLGEPSYATPAVADGVMYLRTRSHLFSLGRYRAG